MTVLRDPGDSRDYPLLHLLPAHIQRKNMVKHGSIQPDGIPMYKGTRSDLMMHVSLLLGHVLSMGNIEEHTTSTEGASVPYICT